VVRVDTRAERRADPTRRFDELFRRLYPRLYDLCHRLLVDRWEAEDVVQEAFLRLVGAAVIDRPDQEVEAWLRRVCVNLGYNRLRGQRRGRERLERASAELAPGAVATVTGVLALVLVATPAGRSAASGFLAQFRSQRFAVVTFDPSQAGDLAATLRQLGVVHGDLGGVEPEPVATPAAASRLAASRSRSPTPPPSPAGSTPGRASWSAPPGSSASPWTLPRSAATWRPSASSCSTFPACRRRRCGSSGRSATGVTPCRCPSPPTGSTGARPPSTACRGCCSASATASAAP